MSPRYSEIGLQRQLLKTNFQTQIDDKIFIIYHYYILFLAENIYLNSKIYANEMVESDSVCYNQPTEAARKIAIDLWVFFKHYYS